MSSMASRSRGNAPASLAKDLGHTHTHYMALAQAGALVPKGSLTPVLDLEGHPSVYVTLAQLHFHAQCGTLVLSCLAPAQLECWSSAAPAPLSCSAGLWHACP